MRGVWLPPASTNPDAHALQRALRHANGHACANKYANADGHAHTNRRTYADTMPRRGMYHALMLCWQRRL